jgi:hypothetical protein
MIATVPRCGDGDPFTLRAAGCNAAGKSHRCGPLRDSTQNRL